MNEHLIRENMQRNRRDPPAWKRELLRQIDSLARLPGAVDVFKRHVQAVSESLASDNEAKDALPELAEGEGMSFAEYHAKYSVRDLLGAGPGLTLPEKFFILAAFHDVLCESERMPPIMNWGFDEEADWYNDPQYPAFCMYGHYAGQCADLPDEKLQPDTLRRYIKEVKAELDRLSDEARKEQTENNPEISMGSAEVPTGPKEKSWFKDHWVGFLWTVLAAVIAGLVLFWLTG